MYTESKLRTILKTISWRFWATITTVGLVFLFVGEPEIALSIGGIEVILKMLIYFIHERTWTKIKFGRSEIKPFIVWLTGFSRGGKSEIADILAIKLINKGLKVQRLDGHTVRHIFKETGFSRNEVNEHIKRVGYLASILEKQGIVVVASFLSPYKSSRDFVREISENFLEVHVATPIDVCKNRDKTGLYVRAVKGEVQNLPGVNTSYEIPQNPELIVNQNHVNLEQSSDIIFNYLTKFIK